MSFIEEADLAHVWKHAASCFDELDAARLFITGGTGFFGCWLLESLRFAKAQLGLRTEVVVLTRDPDAFRLKRPHLANMPGLTLLAGDVQRFTYPSGLFTHVIHAATEASAALNQEQPLMMLDTITQGTRHTLKFAEQAEARKFLLVSSGAVYGVQPPTLSHVDETYVGAPDPLEPMSAYGLGKRLAEHMSVVHAKQHDMEVKIARCFAFVGPYLPLTTHFAIGNFIHNALNQEAIHIQGDGAPYRSYLYAADLVIWLWVILCKGQPNRAYHVGSEEAVTLQELAHIVAGTTNVNLSVVVAKERDLSVLPSRYVPKTHRAQHELQLKQYVSLEDSIKRTIRWESKR